jgi:hypothetical protein
MVPFSSCIEYTHKPLNSGIVKLVFQPCIVFTFLFCDDFGTGSFIVGTVFLPLFLRFLAIFFIFPRIRISTCSTSEAFGEALFSAVSSQSREYVILLSVLLYLHNSDSLC